jgi:import inner membrane translocase subunit TIM50
MFCFAVPVAAIEFYLDTRSQIEDQIRGFSEPSSDKLLPDLLPQEQHVFTLVLDLNETLVYSDWKVNIYVFYEVTYLGI